MIINNVRLYRRKRKLTQTELAHMVYVTKNTISSIELGHYYPSLSLAFALSEVFDCSIYDLFVYIPDS